MYAKVTDGGVTRFFDLNNPRSRRVYKELITHNTGFNVVVGDDNLTPKEFTEEQVKETIEAARAAAKVGKPKQTVSSSRAVKDED